jgi:ATP-dependent 26S proteasome regulatory subunit
MKQCSICKLNKNEIEFHKNQNHKDKLDSRCKSCKHKNNMLNREKYKIYHHKRYIENKKEINEKNRKWYKLNPDKSRNQKLLYTYGITLEQRNKMILDQENKCPICFDILDTIDNKNIHVDHNHNTGKVRAVLCKKCNSMIGLCREREDILLNAIGYLKKHNGQYK